MGTRSVHKAVSTWHQHQRRHHFNHVHMVTLVCVSLLHGKVRLQGGPTIATASHKLSCTHKLSFN
jgi:hypothetical protein